MIQPICLSAGSLNACYPSTSTILSFIPIFRNQSQYRTGLLSHKNYLSTKSLLYNNKSLIKVNEDSTVNEQKSIKRRSLWASVTDSIKETFPLQTMYRADVLQGMSLLYEDLDEQIDVQEFESVFSMSNTFESWFKIMELHIYLMSARLMDQDKIGLPARNALLEEFWDDVEYRSRKLAPVTILYTRKRLTAFRRYQKIAFQGYDEGMQGSDMILAAAIWRRFFNFNYDDVSSIERLVKYMRVQSDHLMKIPFKEFVFIRQQVVVPLSDVTIAKELVRKKPNYYVKG